MKTTLLRIGKTHRGFSLVELLIAITIGLMLLTLLALVFARSSNSQKEITLSAQQIENGRYAVDILSDDIHHAGFWGFYAGGGAAPASLPDPCDTSVAALKTATTMPLQGYSAPSNTTAVSPLPSCLAAGNYLPGTDILVVRRASTVNPPPALSASGVYIQGTTTATDPTNPAIGTGSGTFTICTPAGPTCSCPPGPGTCTGTLTVRIGTGVTVPAPIRAYEVHMYFISPCSIPAGAACAATDDGGSPIPTLKRLELNPATGNMTITPLVEGIENLQVDYGIDNDGDGSPDGATYIADPGTTANWQKVMALRIYVLARNTQISADYSDNKTYALGTAGNITIPAGAAQRYRRHVYTSLVRVKNPSERLETP